MTVSISKMSIDYYLDSAAVGDGASSSPKRDLTAYYTEADAPPGQWFGTGLAGLSLEVGQEVEKIAAKRLYEDALDPSTNQPLGRRPMKAQQTPTDAKTPVGRPAKDKREAVHGFDLTFSVPKSVSVLWAMAGPELQSRLHQAHRAAVDETLAWVEANVVQTRAGHGGVAHVPVTGLVGSSFDHWDSRAGDPQLHTHAVISNRVQRQSDGQWTTLDSYTLHRHVVSISERYNSLLFDRVYETTGALAELRDPQVSLAGDDLGEVAALIEKDASGEQMARVEIQGVPDELIAEFSTRSVLIEQRTDELIASWEAARNDSTQVMPRHVLLRLRQQATLETRTPKDTSEQTLPEKMVTWRERALDAGHDPHAVIAASVGKHTKTVADQDLTDDIVQEIGTWALHDASTRRTTFGRANVLASADRLLRSVRVANAQERDKIVGRVADAALGQAVQLSPDRLTLDLESLSDPSSILRGRSVFDHLRHNGRYATTQMMADEEFLIARATAEGPSADSWHSPKDANDLVVSSGGRSLSDDQLKATMQVLASGRSLESVIGPAGTGKTTTMKAIRTLWEEDKGRGSVVGLAPSAAAASVLSKEIGASTENTAKWLYESVGEGAARRAERVRNNLQKLDSMQPQLTNRPSRGIKEKAHRLHMALSEDYAAQAKYTLRQNQLVVVDEASMTGTATLAELAHQSEKAGAKLLLVGDPAQLEAVDAGGFLGWMERHGPHSTLNRVWRFNNEWERAASLQLRQGKESSVDEYTSNDRIVGAEDNSAAEMVFNAWAQDMSTGQSTLMIASTNESVQDLNQRAQLELAERGDVDLEGETLKLRDDVIAGPGDQVLARRNNRGLIDSDGEFIANGTRLRIDEILPDGSATGTREGSNASVLLDPDYLNQSVELGYATTAHRAQGITVDTSHAMVEQGQTRELLYVAMTRGRDLNRAYVNLPEPEASIDEWGIMREPEPTSAEEVFLGALRNTQAERTAHEVEMHEHGSAESLGRLVHEHAYLQDASETQRTLAWLKDHGIGEEAMANYVADPKWNDLVRANPTDTYVGPNPVLTPDLNCQQLIADCRTANSTRPSPTTLMDIVAPAISDTTEAATQTSTEVQRMTQRRLDVATRQFLEDPDDWGKDVAPHLTKPNSGRNPDTDSTAAKELDQLQAILLWRSISDQETAVEAWGNEPPLKDRYMRHYYDALRHFGQVTDEEEPADSNGVIEPDSWTLAERTAPDGDRLVERLSENPLPPDAFKPLPEDNGPRKDQAVPQVPTPESPESTTAGPDL